MQKSSIKPKPNSATRFKKDHTSYKVRFIPDMQGWLNIHKSINVLQSINRIKNRNHRSISEIQNNLDKNSTLLHDKSLKRAGIEGSYLNIIKYKQ
jgi:hypothetical protein